MKTESNVRVDTLKNRIYLTLEGFHDLDEAIRMRDLYRDAITNCASGFTVLADISRYKPGAGEVQAIHAEAVRLAEEAGVSRVARFIGDTPLGGMQIDRISKTEGHYESANFDSLEEAEAFLDEVSPQI